MFKRQFYALDHSNRDNSASSSSLSTDSDGGGGATLDDDGAWPESSHESDSNVEDDVDPSGSEKLATPAIGAQRRTGVVSDDNSEDSADASNGRSSIRRSTDFSSQWSEAVEEDEREGILDKFEEKSVIDVGSTKQILKCRLCPKIICLSEESMKAHLKSKGHTRSLKQLASGKLRVRLDSDGEEEEEGETHAERHIRTMNASAQGTEDFTHKKRGGGRQRQRKRLKRKTFLAKEQQNSANSLPQATGVRELPSINGSKNVASGKRDVSGLKLQKKKKTPKVTAVQEETVELRRRTQKKQEQKPNC